MVADEIAERSFFMMGSPQKLLDFYLGIQTFSGSFVNKDENHYFTIVI